MAISIRSLVCVSRSFRIRLEAVDIDHRSVNKQTADCIPKTEKHDQLGVLCVWWRRRKSEDLAD